MFAFGMKLCPGDELQSKRILLSKTGQKVYFLKRDNVRKVDMVMAVTLLPNRSETLEDSIEIEVEKIFEMQEARIIFIGFDTNMEIRNFVGAKDAFYILDSNKRIHHLMEVTQMVQTDGGASFQNQSTYAITRTVDLD